MQKVQNKTILIKKQNDSDQSGIMLRYEVGPVTHGNVLPGSIICVRQKGFQHLKNGSPIMKGNRISAAQARTISENHAQEPRSLAHFHHSMRFGAF